MSKIDDVRSAMMAAMKARDKGRKDALSLLLSALKNKAIDKREPLTEEEENAVVLREIKQCQEAIELANGRTEIIADNEQRIAVYREFAPHMMDDGEIRAVISDVLTELGIENPTAAQKGQIMKALMPRVKGKADGGAVNKVLSAILG